MGEPPYETMSLEEVFRVGIYCWILFILLALPIAGWGWSLSVFLGGLLAVVNFKWLARAVDAALLTGESDQGAPALVAYIGRVLLILVGLFAIIHLSFLSLLGALLGLSIFVAAGLFESARLLLTVFRKS